MDALNGSRSYVDLIKKLIAGENEISNPLGFSCFRFLKGKDGLLKTDSTEKKHEQAWIDMLQCN